MTKQSARAAYVATQEKFDNWVMRGVGGEIFTRYTYTEYSLDDCIEWARAINDHSGWEFDGPEGDDGWCTRHENLAAKDFDAAVAHARYLVAGGMD
jgi:hypothetical protein